jgi:hypothetical protein
MDSHADRSRHKLAPMLHTVILVTLAPLIQLLLLLLPAAYLSHKISKRLPEGRLKRILFMRL